MVRQSYWKSKSKVPVWKQKNDDDRLGKDLDKEREFHEEVSEDITNILARRKQKEHPLKIKKY